MKNKKTAVLKMNKKETFPTLNPLHLYVQSVQRILDSFGTKSWWWWLLVWKGAFCNKCQDFLAGKAWHGILYITGKSPTDLASRISPKPSLQSTASGNEQKLVDCFLFLASFPVQSGKKTNPIRIGRGQGDVRIGLGKEQMGKSEDTATWPTSCRENRFCTFPEHSQLVCQGEE